MKFSDAVRNDPTPRMMRTEMAARYVGCLQMLMLMQRAKWVQASTNGNRMKLWDRLKLEACCDRLTAGEFPGR